MKYFTNIKTIEELKKEYKKLVLKLHPDVNKLKNTNEEFKQMQKEYEFVFNKVKNFHKDFDGNIYEKENNETPEKFKEIIDKIIFFKNCEIEIIGNWIWVSGNTKEYSEELKKLNFKWCKNKLSWCYHKEAYRKRNKKHYTMDQIREKFGSQKIANEDKYLEL